MIIWLLIAIGAAAAAARWRWEGHTATAAQLGQLRPVIIMVLMVGGVAVIASWLWMARANRQGRNWARVLSTVLFGLATLQLLGDLRQPEIHGGLGVAALGLLALSWLVGLAAVCLLWRPASRAFFTPQGRTRAG